MEKLIKEYWKVLIFYLVIIICVLFTNLRFNELNEVIKPSDNNIIAFDSK